MTITQEQIAAMAKRLRVADEYAPLGYDGWEAADMLEKIAAERDALIAALKAAEAEVARLVDENEAQRKIISAVAGALSAWPRALQEAKP